jgi:hypothetical protein
VDEAEIVVEETPKRRRRRRWPWVAAFFLFLILAGLLILWLLRFTIAADYIDRELEKRGVRATYDVKRIGFRRQRLENLVIGDPARPDLTARWVEVELDWAGFAYPKIGLITARGVRLRGRVVNGRVSLGEVDKLLPPPTGAPFRLPNQRIDVADAAIGLETPAGNVGIGLSGRGNLSNGFRGHMAAVSHQLSVGECVIAAPHARVQVSVDRHRPTFTGPLRLDSMICEDDFAILAPRFDAQVQLSEGFNAWRGQTRLAAARLAAGPNRLAALRGTVSFAGDFLSTRGRLDVASNEAAVSRFRASGVQLAGEYQVSPRRGHVALDGDLALSGFTAPGALRPVAAALRSAGGSPVGPIGEQLAAALLRAGEGGATARAHLRLLNRDGRGTAQFEDLDFAARSGARLRATSGSGITYAWPSGLIRSDGAFALSGGGLPTARFTIRQAKAGGAIEGTGTVSPLAAGTSRLALGPIRFVAEPSGATRIDTTAVIDGGFDGGRVQGLSVPISGRLAGGGFAFGERCAPASFRRLEVETLVIGPSRLALCPTGRALVWRAPGGAIQGGSEVRNVRLAGTLGRSPIALDAARLRLGLGERAFTGSGVTVRLGRDPGLHRLQVAELAGRFVGRDVEGTFRGLSGKLAAVPLLISDGTGRWSVRRGDLSLAGSVRVADERDPDRFYPMVSDDFRLTLAENRIRTTATLRHPESGTRIVDTAIAHDLRSGTGAADLSVPGIAFSLDGLQPEDLTRLTVGAVALVEGTLRGTGRIDWRPGSTTSSGTFSTEDMNLAAAFGPVEGLTTSVHFTDLLRLESAPGQVAQIDMIRAGIDVANGTLRYQLRPGSLVQVEGGQWPLWGGELLLQPTLLDFSRPSTKYLTFQVVGVDAEKVIENAALTSIELTGIFDGVLPMEFDVRGGRIVGGRLEARPGGGTLSYVAPVDRANMPIGGRIAFDALRSIRYNRLEIQLDGALAGEFLSRIRLDGLTLATRQNWLVRRFANIPFRFNITVRGPLRAVIGITRDMKDPSTLIQPVLPEALQGLPTTVTTITEEPATITEEKESEKQP